MVYKSNERSTTGLSRAATVGVVLTATVAVLWFIVSWAVLGSPVVDAIGEAFGGVAVLLVVISIVGSTWKGR